MTPDRLPLLACMALLALTGPPARSEQAAAASATGARRGQLLFITQCRACHALEAANDPLKIGPHLQQLLGRVAGAVSNYKYSEAMEKSGIVWTREQLDLWLQNPARLVPGTTMTFTGLTQPEDRTALLDYLATVSAAH